MLKNKYNELYFNVKLETHNGIFVHIPAQIPFCIRYPFAKINLLSFFSIKNVFY